MQQFVSTQTNKHAWYHKHTAAMVTELFATAGPRLWNSLPVQLCNPDITYGLFRRQLKGHHFRNHGHGIL